MGRQSRSCRKPAEYRGFAYTTITSSSHHDRQRHPKRGPNRRTRAENQFSPHRHRPSHAQRPHPCRKTAEYQGSSQRHKDQPPAHQPRNHPSPRTEPEITSRNRNQSIPKPVCTGATNHRTTAKPQNSKYLPAELQSSTTKSAAQPAQATDRTGKHQPKTSPVHTSTDRHTPSDHAQTANRETPTVLRHHKDQPPTHRPHNHPSPRTEPEITRRNRNQSTPAPANTQMPTTTPLQNRGRPTVRSFRHNPPPPGQIPETPAPRTESENESKKSIQSHNGTRSPGTPTTATLEMRNTSTIRQHREHQPPALRYPDSPYFRNY